MRAPRRTPAVSPRAGSCGLCDAAIPAGQAFTAVQTVRGPFDRRSFGYRECVTCSHPTH